MCRFDLLQSSGQIIHVGWNSTATNKSDVEVIPCRVFQHFHLTIGKTLCHVLNHSYCHRASATQFGFDSCPPVTIRFIGFSLQTELLFPELQAPSRRFYITLGQQVCQSCAQCLCFRSHGIYDCNSWYRLPPKGRILVHQAHVTVTVPTAGTALSASTMLEVPPLSVRDVKSITPSMDRSMYASRLYTTV